MTGVTVAVLALLGGLVVGRLRGLRLHRFGAVGLRHPWLALAGAAAQLAGLALPSGYGVALAVSAALVLAFVAANRTVPGLLLVGAGLAANAVVVAANGQMPVSAAAARSAGVSVAGLAGDPRHTGATPATRLRALGDVVPVPLPVGAAVLSPGDVLVAAGLGLFGASVLVARGPRRSGAGRSV